LIEKKQRIHPRLQSDSREYHEFCGPTIAIVYRYNLQEDDINHKSQPAVESRTQLKSEKHHPSHHLQTASLEPNHARYTNRRYCLNTPPARQRDTIYSSGHCVPAPMKLPLGPFTHEKQNGLYSPNTSTSFPRVGRSNPNPRSPSRPRPTSRLNSHADSTSQV
jgi:hypothetical protein